MAIILKNPEPVKFLDEQVDKNDRMDWTSSSPDKSSVPVDTDRTPDWGTPPDALPWIPLNGDGNYRVPTPTDPEDIPDGYRDYDHDPYPDNSDRDIANGRPDGSASPNDDVLHPGEVAPEQDPYSLYHYISRSKDFEGTPFESQYDYLFNSIIKQIEWALANENAWEKLGFSMNCRDYIQNLINQYQSEISNLYSAMRDYNRNLPATEAELMEDAGLNPDLLGVDGASGGSGSGGSISSPTAQMKTAVQPLEQMLDIVGAISSIVGLGAEVAEAASTIKLQDSQAELNRVNASNAHQRGLNESYQLAAEYVMQTYDPTPDESGSIPKFGVKSIPGVPDEFQKSAVAFAERFAASDYYFAERNKLSADASNSAFDYATILANPLYSSNFDDMTSIIADYSRIELDLQLSMFEKQQAMLDLNTKYTKLLSPYLMAAAQNGINLSQVEYYVNFDAAAAANAANKEAGFRGEYYEKLDANVASDFENYQKEYLRLETEINKVLSDARITLLNRKRADLYSPNPMRRYMAARALQRIDARSNRRMSETPTQRGNSSLQGAMDAGVKASLIGSNVMGAGAGAAGAELLPYVVSGTY